MDGRRLLDLLRPVRLRLQWLRTAETGLLGAAVGAAAGLLLTVAAWMLPVAYYRVIAAALVPLGMMAGAVYVLLLRRVRAETAAEAVDASGGDDAVRTALEYLGEDTPIVRMQREGAIRYAEAYAAQVPKRELSPLLRRRLWIAAGSVVLMAIVVAVPSPMDQVVAQRQEEAQWIDEQKQKVEELKADISEELTSDVKKALEDRLNRLEEGLEQSRTVPEALDEMEKAMKELNAEAKELEKQQMKADQWAERLKHEPMLKDVGESLRQMDEHALQKGMEQLQNQMLKLTPEQKEALAELLEKLAASANPVAETEKKLREAMERAAAELKANAKASAEGAAADPKLLEERLLQLDQQLAEALKQLQQNAAQLTAAAQQAAGIAQLGLPMAGQLAGQGAALPSAWLPGGLADALAAAGGASPAGAQPGTGAQPSAGTGAAAGAGAGAGAGAAAGAGAGAGAAAGAGAGAGAGTGGGGGTGGLQGGFGSGHRNLVATPRGLEGSGNIQSDQGPTVGGGELQKGGPSPVIDGTSRPYEEVYSEYEKEAKRALDRQPLPQNMQNLVRDYFTEIQPNP